MKKAVLLCKKDNFLFVNRKALELAQRKFSKFGFETEVIFFQTQVYPLQTPDGESWEITVADGKSVEAFRKSKPDIIFAPNSNSLWSFNAMENGRISNVVFESKVPAISMCETVHLHIREIFGIPDLAFNFLRTSENFLYFPYDIGDLKILENDFGINVKGMKNMIFTPISYLADMYIESLDKANGEKTFDVVHVGEMPISRLSEVFNLPPPYRKLVEKVIKSKISNLEKPLWEIYKQTYTEFFGEVSPQKSSTFWKIYTYISDLIGKSVVRIEILRSVGRKIYLFGGFSHTSVQEYERMKAHIERLNPNIKHMGLGPRDVRRIYKASKLAVIITNVIVQDAVHPKIVETVLCGALPLCDPRPYLFEFFGPEVKKITWKNPRELEERIDHFLANEKERCELVTFMQEKVKEFVKGLGTEGILDYMIQMALQ